MLSFVLNGIDSFQFSVHLDAQAAYQISPLRTVVKVWRQVPGQPVRPRGFPNFCGVVGPSTRNAAGRTASYTVFSPFWRLQSRHHIDPHDFTPETGIGYPVGYGANGTAGLDPSEIMWRMVSFTQNLVNASTSPVFGPVARTAGIAQGGLAVYPGGSPILISKHYDRGQNTWDLIQGIVNEAGMPDLSPTYFHVDGSPEMVYFNTVVKKGSARAQTFDYRTGQYNLDDLTETYPLEPGNFATYVVVQGQLDSDKYQEIVRADGLAVPIARGSGSWTPPDLIDQIGLYIKFDSLPGSSATDKQARAQYLLSHLMNPPVNIEVSLSKALVWNYPNDFEIGDTVTVNCDRDALQIAGLSRRIQQVTVQRGADGAEQLTVQLAEDFDDPSLT